MRLHKLLRFSSIGLFCLTVSIGLFFSLQAYSIPTAQKPKTLAFLALQRRGSEVINSLFTINANGEARRELTPKIDASYTLFWSPNGQRLAFVSGDTDVYTVNADGSRITKLWAGEWCKATNFAIAWFSNSQKLVFARSCDGFTSDSPGSQSLYLSDTSGIEGTKLIRTWEAGGHPPKTEISSEFYLSPDGQQITFVKDRNIYKMNADGSGMTKLTKTPGEYTSGGSQLVWSPDRTKIAFFFGTYPKQQDIYAIDVNRGTARNLTQKPSNYDALSWSPDGKIIAFANGDFYNQKLYTINPDGSKLTQLVPRLELSGISQLVWSSDSRQIAFAFNDIRGDKGNLYVINRDGSGLAKLTNDRDLNASSPVWQPQ